MQSSNGRVFRALVESEKPLQVMGAINAYSAILAKSAGCKALYLSGAGVANASFGIPDLGMTSLTEVAEEARRITAISPLPLLVDADTGWGHDLNIARTVQQLERAGVAAIHIEDQVLAKRCGHRPNKSIVSQEEMGDRIKAAVDARLNSDFVIMARTDAFAVEGMQCAIERAQRCVELGADMIFPEAMHSLDDYQMFCDKVSVPVLANITEFGKTPLFTREELHQVGVKLVLYPLSAFRAMSKAALAVYKEVVQNGSQSGCIEQMQTREELYTHLEYHRYEDKLDQVKEYDNE